MTRLGAICSSALVTVLASPALADLLIEIPDVPTFDLTDPIVSDEPVRIIGTGATAVTIGSITAPEVTIELGDGSDLRLLGDISVDGTPEVAAGSVTLVSTGVLRDAEGNIIPRSGITIDWRDTDLQAEGVVLEVRDDNSIRLDGVSTNGGSITVTGGVTGVADLIVTDSGDIVAIPVAADTGTGVEGLSADLGRAQVFAERLFSCPTAEDPAAQRTCAWTSAEGSRTEFTGTGPYNDTTFSFAMGAQAEIADGWFLGGALGVDSSDTTALTSETESERVRAGLVVKYVDGPLTAGLAVTGGLGQSDLTRSTGGGVATADFASHALSIRADATYTHRIGAAFLQPGLGVSFTHLSSEDFTETGAGIANRTVQGADVQSIGLHPRIRLGGDLILGPYDTRVRPSLTLGLDWQSNPDLDVATSAGIQRLEGDELLGTIAAGLDIFADDDVEIGVTYRGRLGADTESHGGEVRLRLGL